MRASLPLLAALVFSLWSTPSLADPAREVVIRTRQATAALSPRTRAIEARSPRLWFGDRLGARLDSLGLAARASLVDGLAPDQDASKSNVASRAARSTRGLVDRANPFDLDPSRVWLLEASDSLAAIDAARVLASDPAIEWVEINQPREPEAISLDSEFPSDPFFRDSRQWGLRNLGPSGAYGGIAGADVHALDAWKRSTGSRDVLLAVADTGIDPDHPELNALLRDGAMRIARGLNVTADPSPSYADSFGHGTPVAGVMAARTGEGAHAESLGIAGVCGGDGLDNPGCRILPIKIAPGHSGGASSFDIARAIIAATDAGACVMNLSYGGAGASRLEREALYYAITRGCVVVAAAGNDGGTHPTRPVYPAAYAADGLCIQVGASDPADGRAGFSSYGPGLDLIAPGLDIWTTFMTYPSAMGVMRNGYVVGSGTSFAAPFVTGAVGLLEAARPELMDVDLQRVLRESADDVGIRGVDAETGWGRLDIAAALDAVGAEFGIWHDEALADFTRAIAADTLIVVESGPGEMRVPRAWPGARLVEVTACVALPDSFLDPVRVWPRVSGTMTVRGDFRLPYFAPWAEVASRGPDSFTLRGFFYEVPECAGCDTTIDLPLPRDQARFGFTVLGRVDRPPSLEIVTPTSRVAVAPGESLAVSWRARDPDEITAFELWLVDDRGGATRVGRVSGAASGAFARIPCPAPIGGDATLYAVALDEHGRHHDRASVGIPIRISGGTCLAVEAGSPPLGVSPNPFRDAARVSGPRGARLEVLDVSGRVVRRARLDGSFGAFEWDGRDQTGRALGPGLYFIRCESARGHTQTRVLKLE